MSNTPAHCCGDFLYLFLFDITIPSYILWYMNTKTILNIKTDKSLKAKAQRTAEKMGLPLSTIMNAFLKQFVRDEEITFSASSYEPSDYLIKIVKESEKDFVEGRARGPFSSAKEMIADLNR